MVKRKSPPRSLGKGPAISVGANLNPKVYVLLKEAAKEAKVDYQIFASPNGTGTDANAMQITRAGVATGLVCIPCRYMHTPNEVVSLKDLENTVRLVAQLSRMIDESVDFIPQVGK